MNSFKSPALLTALLAVAFLPAEAKPVNVAGCNLSRVFNDCNWTKDKQAELEVRRSQVRKELESYKKKIEALERERPLAQKGSQKEKDLLAEIDRVKAETKAKAKVESAHWERKFTDFLKEFHSRALETIEVVAKQKGFDLVLQTSTKNLGGLSRAQEIQFRISTQNVLFAEKSVEITDLILEKLDDEYKKQKDAK